MQRESRERTALQAQTPSSLSQKSQRMQVQEESGCPADVWSYNVSHMLYYVGRVTKSFLQV